MAYDKFIIKNGAVIESILTGSTVLDIQGKNGQLFSVTDNLVGDVFAVSDITGIPILKVNSNGKVTIDGSADISESVNIGTDLNITGALYVNGFRTSGKNTGDQPLGNLATYDYVDQTFLPLTGGTLTGVLHMSNTVIDGNGGSLNLGGYNSNMIYLQTTGKAYYSPAVGTDYELWHKGNSGTRSYDWNAKIIYANDKIRVGTKWAATIASDGEYFAYYCGHYGIGFSTNHLNIGEASGEKMRLTAGGNLIVGTTIDSSYKFDVAGTGRFTGKLMLDASEGLGVYGIRGRTTNEQIEMYQKVSIGSPNGWGSFPQAPDFGLSTYGGANFCTNQGIVLIGTTTDSSSGKLQVIGDINASGKINFGSINNKCQMTYNSTENSIDFIIN